MKKQNLQLKLNLKKQTVTELNAVKGGAPNNLPSRVICKETAACDTQVHPCCPACLSGFSQSVAADICAVTIESINAICPAVE